MAWKRQETEARVLRIAPHHHPQNTHCGIGKGIVSREWQVVVGDSVGYQTIILCLPQRCVEVCKVVVQVDALLGPAALSPAYQLRALPGRGLFRPGGFQASGWGKEDELMLGGLPDGRQSHSHQDSWRAAGECVSR